MSTEAPAHRAETVDSVSKKLLVSNTALAISAGLVLLSVIRVYYFCNFDVQVALATLSVANRTQVLISTMFNFITTVVPFLFTMPAVRRWLWAGNSNDASPLLTLRTALIWVPLTPLVALSMSIPVAFGWFLGAASLFIVRKVRKSEKPPKKPASVMLNPVWIMSTLAGFLILFTLYTPWQAREAITIAGEPTVGYVIGEQAGQTLILDYDKKAMWVKTSDVGTRELCKPTTSWYSGTLASITNPAGVDCLALVD
ncbi:hypothetical protein [Naasia lichenicola]|uniref:Uncharacterized protein n=1 Tax=Naasia lichenicola TaxID=2565933 RepID=A0A4S4FUY9_9MICO|nr:hypothetical protein [Naasia lichenicola]THG33446.1 hypothetical protein E6C64_03660 [Naasia lichenicola]